MSTARICLRFSIRNVHIHLLVAMKPIAVLYATREGQTRRIAERVGEDFRAREFDARVKNLRDDTAAIHLNDYAGVVLAASVHGGKHEREMVKFVKMHSTELKQLPTAFLSVTLSGAGVEMSRATLEKCARGGCTESNRSVF
jgi:menaquinone-dependent protoporphyrinogen oxidase